MLVRPAFSATDWYRCKAHKTLGSHTSSALFAALELGTENHYFGSTSEMMVVRNDTVYRSVVIFQMGLFKCKLMEKYWFFYYYYYYKFIPPISVSNFA